MGLLVKKAFILAFIPLIMFLLIKFFRNNTRISDAHREFIIEFTFIGAGLLSTVI